MSGFGGTARRPRGLISRSARFEFIPEFPNKTLHRPGTGLSERTNRSSARDVIRDPEQVLRILFPPFSMGESMQRLAHPERSLPARGALPATLMRVKF
jgi:hypothetical protein